MSERFFLDHPLEGEVSLTGPEAHHLVHVMRARIGQRVHVFNGRGDEAVAEISDIQKKSVALRILEQRVVSRELSVALTVACTLPKGDRERFLIEKLTELGVASFIPLVTQRTIVRPDDKVIERLRRVVVEACKQCGRNQLMVVGQSLQWGDLVARSDGYDLRLFAHPFSVPHFDGGAESIPMSSLATIVTKGALLPDSSQRILVAVGPEGGLSEGEVSQAIQAGWGQIDLGPRILRTETAAIVVATLLGGICDVRVRGPAIAGSGDDAGVGQKRGPASPR